MQIDGLDWMDWLHKMRAENARLRREKGISVKDDLKESTARGRSIMAELRARERSPVVRDKPPGKPVRKRRKP